jgi:hypothetical protein
MILCEDYELFIKYEQLSKIILSESLLNIKKIFNYVYYVHNSHNLTKVNNKNNVMITEKKFKEYMELTEKYKNINGNIYNENINFGEKYINNFKENNTINCAEIILYITKMNDICFNFIYDKTTQDNKINEININD